MVGVFITFFQCLEELPMLGKPHTQKFPMLGKIIKKSSNDWENGSKSFQWLEKSPHQISSVWKFFQSLENSLSRNTYGAKEKKGGCAQPGG